MSTERDEPGGDGRCAYPSCQARTEGSLFCPEHKPVGYTVGTPHPSVAYVDGRYVEQRPAPTVTSRVCSQRVSKADGIQQPSPDTIGEEDAFLPRRKKY